MPNAARARTWLLRSRRHLAREAGVPSGHGCAWKPRAAQCRPTCAITSDDRGQRGHGTDPDVGRLDHHSLEALLVDICAVLLQQQAHALDVVDPSGFMQRVVTGLCGGWCVCKRIGAYALRMRERKHAGDDEEDSRSEDDDAHVGK